MASAGYGQAQDQVRGIVAEAKSLTVDKLKHVLRQEQLTVSGVKSELQIRLIAHIEKTSNAGDQARLERIRNLIRGVPIYNSNNSYPSPYSQNTPASSASPQFSSPIPPRPAATSLPYNMAASRPFPNNNRITFRNSPFYTITQPLTDIIEVKARETTRDTARATITLSTTVAELLQRDSNARVMVFCAAEAYNPVHRDSDISFPHQVELKCNQDDVKANLRGLKNKPGSTRPADVTSFIRKKPGYPNSIEMVYALTTKKFYLVVNLVMKKPVDALVSELRQGKYISKERVLREMQSKAADPDIVATSAVMSLKCPLSFTRITTPCRSIGCAHNQCFDAASYLQLQEQAPTWVCPVCNKSAPFENLVIDQYVNDILNTTNKDTEQVTVEPDGTWHKQVEEPNNTGRNNNPTPSDDDDDDDDLIEIQDGPSSVTSYMRTQPQTLTPNSVRTPPINGYESRAASASASVPRSSTKRTRDEVIDLTLSDDDDHPPTKVKRPSISTTASFGSRPPDRYQFHLPPPNLPNLNYDRFGNF